MKKCSACGDLKELSEFHKDKQKKGGHRNECKLCRKESEKKYYEENAEIICERNRKDYAANPEKSAEAVRKWREANPDKVAKYNATTTRKEFVRKWRKANSDKVAKYNKKYYKARKSQRQEGAHTDDTDASDRG